MKQTNHGSASEQLSRSHWKNYPKWWDLLESPLRPSSEDLDFIRQTILSNSPTINNLERVALLGVTPEIALLPWPEITEISAIDSSQRMIHTVWPGDQIKRGRAIYGDWKNLPLPSDSHNLVIGDGCFTLLDYPNGYKEVLKEISRILKPGGFLLMRFFVKPSEHEEPRTIFDDLINQSISNFHVFKFRLAMALQDRLEAGVAVHDVWEFWHNEFSQPGKIFQDLGWPIDLIETIEMYKKSPSIYTFPTLSEVRSLFSAYFTEETFHIPTYELGERCPSILFRVKK